MKKGCVIALGFFDGVHRGHGTLLQLCRQEADLLSASAIALTFDRHPAAFLTGARIPLLSPYRERQRVMGELYGIEQLVELTFNEAMANMPWESFLHQILVDTLGAVCLVCGEDYRFGKGGTGTAELLKEACEKLGVACHIVPALRIHGDIVSSTRIRGLISQGEMEEAAELLGYPYRLTGKVVSGRGLGRTLGMPTANLAWENELLPPNGVYIARAITEEGVYPAVVNIGSRPTVDGSTVTVEPWLLDFSGDLYGKRLSLELYKFLRPEQKFPDLDALRNEILRNAQQTRIYFSQK